MSGPETLVYYFVVGPWAAYWKSLFCQARLHDNGFALQAWAFIQMRRAFVAPNGDRRSPTAPLEIWLVLPLQQMVQKHPQPIDEPAYFAPAQGSRVAAAAVIEGVPAWRSAQGDGLRSAHPC